MHLLSDDRFVRPARRIAAAAQSRTCEAEKAAYARFGRPRPQQLLARSFRSSDAHQPAAQGAAFEKDHDMAKGQQRGNREARKPKKPGPLKQNASNPSLKGTPPTQPPKKG